MKIFIVPFMFILPALRTIADLFGLAGVIKDHRMLSQVARGVAMTIPVLIIFSVLFSSADLVFKKHLLNLIDIDIQAEDVFRSILVCIVTVIFIGAYSHAFREIQETLVPRQSGKMFVLGHVETSILLGSVNILFFAFILVQLTYLFGGQSNISSEGFTYSEYARRGFFELMTVAVISFLLLWATEKDIAKTGSEHSLPFKILGSALVVQVILIMVSAFKRLSLYEEAYGFTTLRLYSHAFIVFLAVIFLLLLYKIHLDKREETFAFRSFVSIILFLAVMNLLNPDAFIARHNIRRFSKLGELDIAYLSSLSDDAIPEAIKVLEIQNENIRGPFAHNLQSRRNRINSPVFSRWQSFNLSRVKAGRILESSMNLGMPEQAALN